MKSPAPNPERIRAIGEHIYSLGCYTQAEELDRAADALRDMAEALRNILAAADNDSQREVWAAIDAARAALAKAGL